MAVVYLSLIIKGLKTLNDVPVKQKAAVQELLLGLDLDESGVPL